MVTQCVCEEISDCGPRSSGPGWRLKLVIKCYNTGAGSIWSRYDTEAGQQRGDAEQSQSDGAADNNGAAIVFTELRPGCVCLCVCVCVCVCLS
ncbi:hypothetical protein FQN60_014302, partial [Etheostoma spectabile]